MRRRPEGSATARSPARMFRASPPDDGIDQIAPRAEKYKSPPSGEQATELTGPLPGAILRTTRPDAGSVNAMVSYGGAPIMNATSRDPHVAKGAIVSSDVLTRTAGSFPFSITISRFWPDARIAIT